MGTYLNAVDDLLGGHLSSLDVWVVGYNNNGNSRREDACRDGRHQPLCGT
jgi:hypothetical protein